MTYKRVGNAHWLVPGFFSWLRGCNFLLSHHTLLIPLFIFYNPTRLFVRFGCKYVWAREANKDHEEYQNTNHLTLLFFLSIICVKKFKLLLCFYPIIFNLSTILSNIYDRRIVTNQFRVNFLSQFLNIKTQINQPIISFNVWFNFKVIVIKHRNISP